jgi:hypothetical protein
MRNRCEEITKATSQYQGIVRCGERDTLCDNFAKIVDAEAFRVAAWPPWR